MTDATRTAIMMPEKVGFVLALDFRSVWVSCHSALHNSLPAAKKNYCELTFFCDSFRCLPDFRAEGGRRRLLC